MPTFRLMRWLGRGSLWIYRAITWTLLGCCFGFALVVAGARFWLLPNIGEYKETIARHLSEATRHRVTIGSLQGHWSGFNLQLGLGDLALYDKGGQPALRLARVDATLSWWSLVHGEPRFDAIEVSRPSLAVRRDTKGIITVAGIEVTGGDGGGLSDWVLRQDQILIREAEISWKDELRAAPELRLGQVEFRLENDGRHHRFGLRAVPPEHLALPLDLRGDIQGRTVSDLAQWNGQLFARFDYVDIAGLRPWIEFPLSFPHGVGALRLWVTMQRGVPVESIADVELSQVKAQLKKELPELDLDALHGRIVWKSRRDGFDLTTSRLTLTTQGGAALQPMDMQLKISEASDKARQRGEFFASALEIEPLHALASRLPLDDELRKALESHAPHGSVFDLALKWTGALPRPEQYSIKGRFVNLGVSAFERWPGFSGVSGQIDGNERGGNLVLNAQNAVLDMPRVFAQKLALDMINVQSSWQRVGEQYEFRFNNASFSNPDAAGSISGSYQTVANGRGIIDLTGIGSRASARNIGRYVPLQLSQGLRDWLESAFAAGDSSDVKLRLKGDLAHFPFADGKDGMFQVTAQITGGTFDYVRGWPRIENVDADLVFRGRRMEVQARSATILGAKLSRVRAELAEMDSPNRVLAVSGEAEGATAEFLKFIEQSPVIDMIDRFVEGVTAQGNGQLGLKLTIPLASPRDTRVSGVYTLIDNTLRSPELPFTPEQINGRLEFTENSVRASSVNMTLLGGPASMNAVTQRDGVTRVNLAGRINMDDFRRANDVAWARALQGSTDWKAAITLRQRTADYLVESNLQGITSQLPAPFNKSAGDSWPLQFERNVQSAQQERIQITLGNLVSAQLQRRRDGNQYVIDRGNISLGASAAPPDRNGVWVNGGLRGVDLDQWLVFLRNLPPGGNRIQLNGMDVRLGVVDVFGRRFNDVAVNGSAQGGNWQFVLAGRELAGDVAWRPQGKGRLVAHMKQLAIPRPSAPRSPPPAGADKEAPQELPALDLTAENFMVNGKALGKLELAASPDGRDWRLERLRVTNPDATINIEGLWQAWLSQPRTMVNVKLEISDVGKFLMRLGYPEGVRRGTAKLEGPLSWAGSPAELDYESLSGSFLMEAAKGQFVKLEPGVGKLLGILSLQALPRRLSLDFRDIFSEGLAFDEIIGAVKVNKGVASTDNLRLIGPAVRIQMAGDVDINAETQKLRVKVFPSVSDGLSVAGALVSGPVAGIASFVLQRLLRNPLDQLAAYEYAISGTWTDPQVTKIVSQTQNEEKQQ